jgi:hypothetical protein
MRDDQGGWRWIPFLGDHGAVDEARALPEDVGTITPLPCLFEGLDLGHFFERLHRATKDTFLGYSCALFVVEPDPAVFAVVLHLRDWGELLADRRVFVFFGDSCTERLCQAWETDLDLPWPRQVYTLSAFRPGCSPSAVNAVSEAAGERGRKIEESHRRIEVQYASRDIRYWAQRFDEALAGEGEPLRVLAAVSTHTTFLQHSMRDTKRALENLGHRCVVLTEKTDYDIIGPLTYHNAIREFDPDVFLNIDHLRPEFGSLIPSNLPILTWDQDMLPHVFTKENMERIARHDFVAGCSKSNFVRAGFNPKQFLHARVPTCPEQFGGDPLTDEEIEHYTCEVSYVSHASQTPRQFHEEERAGYKNAALAVLLDEMYELLLPMLAKHHTMPAELPVVIVQEASRRCGVTVDNEQLRERLMWWYLWRLADRIFRHEALEWVAQWARSTGRTLRIYGNGWDKHPTLSEFAAGPADNGRELLCIYRASKINLQLMPAGFIHQRALDGLAGGGFFLTRLVPKDLRGRTLRRLEGRIRELGITRQRELFENPDTTLQTLLHEYIGESLQWLSPDDDGLLNGIRLSAELPFPDEVFPHFHEIVFDSAERFARTADAFLADDAKRRTITEEMRQVVIEHFSYPPTIDRFLHAMAEYLREACA